MNRKIGNTIIAVVWLVNGLFCKIFNLVSRHQEIVGRILGSDQAVALTKTIGILEIGMFVWILTGKWPKQCAIIQIIVILLMNCIEFVMVPQLLLFGKLNLIFAVVFSGFIYANAFLTDLKN